MLSEEKNKKKLINANIITRYNAVMSNADIHFQLIQIFSNESK